MSGSKSKGKSKAKKTTAKKAAAKSAKATGVSVGVVSDHDVYSQWTFGQHSSCTSFEYDWEYYAKGWLPGAHGTVDVVEAQIGGKKSTTFRHEYSAPAEATSARFRVRPVSKTKSVKSGKSTKTVNVLSKISWCGFVKHVFSQDKLPAPEVETDLDDNGLTVTVSVESDDNDAKYYDIKCESGGKAVKNVTDKALSGGKGSTDITMNAGQTWKFSARVKTVKDKDKDSAAKKAASGWSAGEDVKARPAAPSSPSASALSSSSAKVTWVAAAGAETYTAEYVADSADYFDSNPGEVHTKGDITGTTFLPTGLDEGHTWFFRVKAVNDSGESGWTGAVSTVLATVPEAPTTFDTEPAYTIDDTALIRWVHNSEDGSEQAAAQVELTVNGEENVESLSDDDFLEVGLSSYPDGALVSWRVRTKGAHPD